MKPLPSAFVDRMKTLLGPQAFEAFLASFDQPPQRAFRVNTDKIDTAAFAAVNPFSCSPIPYVENGYYLNQNKIGLHPFHHAGMIYLQDPGAMAAAECLTVNPDWWVLDLCAAPGGKSSQIKNKLGKNGLLVANEIIPSRCKILTGNVERLGLTRTATTCLDPARLAALFPQTFDLVVVDAPCSGEGMFRKDEAAIDEWSPENVKMCAERQKEILANVAKCVAHGGKLIYSTCTFSLEENEMNVAWFLDNFSDFKLVNVTQELKEFTSDGINFEGCTYDMTKTRRFYPHISKGEGQFIAVLARADGVSEETPTKKDKKKRQITEKLSREDTELIAEAKHFLEENLVKDFEGGVSYSLIALNGKAYLKPDIALPPYGVFAAGVCVGEIVGKRFVPHHQLFSAYGGDFKRKVILKQSDPEAYDYIKGMEISVSHKEEFEKQPDGWAAVLVDNCPLGGGKISGGVCKNHYPKGLRNQQ